MRSSDGALHRPLLSVRLADVDARLRSWRYPPVSRETLFGFADRPVRTSVPSVWSRGGMGRRVRGGRHSARRRARRRPLARLELRFSGPCEGSARQRGRRRVRWREGGGCGRSLPANAAPIAEFAAHLTGDAHALHVGEPRQARPPLCGAPRQRQGLDDVEQRRSQAWACRRRLADELSAPVLVLNLRAVTGDVTARAMALHADASRIACERGVELSAPARPSRRRDRASRLCVREPDHRGRRVADRLGARSAPPCAWKEIRASPPGSCSRASPAGKIDSSRAAAWRFRLGRAPHRHRVIRRFGAGHGALDAPTTTRAPPRARRSRANPSSPCGMARSARPW